MSNRQNNKAPRNAPSPRPRFLQIADEISRQISTGALKEHDILPSERSLSEHYNVSRMTGRRALEALESTGLVYSADRRGRFVSPQRLKYNVSNMVSFVSTAQTNDIDLKIELIEAAQTKANSKIAALLERDEGSAVLKYTRLFHTGAHPTFIETEYLIADLFPDFLDHDLRQSTTQILEEVYGTSAHTGDIVIRMRAAHANEARLLNIAANHTVIELEQLIRDEKGVAFCFGRQVWRGEMAEFSAQAIVTGQNRGKDSL